MPAWAPDVECCCVSHDANQCAHIRYGRKDCIGELQPFDPSIDDPCDCICHDPEEDDWREQFTF